MPNRYVLFGIRRNVRVLTRSSQVNPFLSGDGFLAKHRDAFTRLTKDLMKNRSVTVASGSYVDIIRDVVNLVPVYWISELVRAIVSNVCIFG